MRVGLFYIYIKLLFIFTYISSENVVKIAARAFYTEIIRFNTKRVFKPYIDTQVYNYRSYLFKHIKKHTFGSVSLWEVRKTR